MQFLEPFVEVCLAAGKFLETVEHLQLFALLRVLLLLGRLSFGLVAVFRLRKFQLIQLFLRPAAATSAAALRLVAGHLEFAGLEL